MNCQNLPFFYCIISFYIFELQDSIPKSLNLKLSGAVVPKPTQRGVPLVVFDLCVHTATKTKYGRGKLKLIKAIS
jgi:hypothetical protein